MGDGSGESRKTRLIVIAQFIYKGCIQNGHKPKRPHDYGEHVNQYLSLNKLGIIKSQVAETHFAAGRINSTVLARHLLRRRGCLCVTLASRGVSATAELLALRVVLSVRARSGRLS